MACRFASLIKLSGLELGQVDVVELPQMPGDDLTSARVASGRQTS